MARGEDGPGSDVDVALVVSRDDINASHQVRDEIQALGDTLSMNFSVVALTRTELAAIRKDDPWWAGVIRDAKVLKGLGPAGERDRSMRVAPPA